MHYFLNWPRLTIICAVLITIFLAHPISQMQWSLTLPDLLSPNSPSRAAAEQVEEKFGGFGSLSVLVNSPDSTSNKEFVEKLAQALADHPLINFCEYKTESEFYKEYQLLYIRLRDLQEIRDRIHHTIEKHKITLNPLIVELNEQAPHNDSSLNLNDLREKYLKDLKNYHGSSDKSILRLEIFPNFPINDLNSNRQLLKDVRRKSQNLSQKHQEIVYAGKVFENASTGGMLLKEIRRLAWIAVAIIVLFIFLWFIHTPQVPFIAAISVAMAVVWTLGINAMVYGEMNIFTLLLGLILPGLGVTQVFHFMTRYSEERRKGLGIELALESTLLGLGPIISITSLISALAFFALILIPLAGIKQMGIVGGLGIILTWIAIFWVFPALLLVLQKNKAFTVYGDKIPHKFKIPKLRPLNNKLSFAIILALTGFLVVNGFFPDFY